MSVQIPKPPGTSLSGGGTVGAAPTYSGAPPTFSMPQMQTAGGTNPTQQIADTLSASTQKPIKAYVVSGDVSSQQALDRKTSFGATFGNG